MPDYPDLPPVSEDPNQPLPDVTPTSELVPYRIGRKDPGGEYQYTTGYAPRGRPAIAPPQGMGFSGAGVPDLSPLISEAFQRLPVDEALKAVEAASRYIGQRGYMKDLESGQNAAQAFAKWGPMLFRQATGLPEAINRTVPTPLSQMQRYQIQRNQLLDPSVIAERNARAAAATAKAKADAIPKPQSAIAKIIADKQRAIQAGADEATVKAFDDAIAKETKTAIPPGTITYDQLGQIKEARGEPGSQTEKIIKEKVRQQKIAKLPKPSIFTNKLSKERAQLFMDAADGNKDEAIKLAKGLGWDVSK